MGNKNQKVCREVGGKPFKRSLFVAIEIRKVFEQKLLSGLDIAANKGPDFTLLYLGGEKE